MEHKSQAVKSTLGNNITIALFLVVTIWGILVTTVIQSQLKNILLKEKLAHNIIEDINRQFVLLSTGVTILGIVAVLGVAFIFSKKITKSIKQLTSGVMKVAAGDLDTKLDITSQDEIGQLANSFNKMIEDLKSSTTSIVNLNKEVAERKQTERAMARLNKQLKKTNAELKDFVYIASHDLREPLRKITSFGLLLKQSLSAKITDADDKENLDFMIDGASRMTKMIEGLLTYAYVSTKNQILETVDVNEIIDQLKGFELAVLLDEKNATINIPQPLPFVKADPVQIRQLLQNLIANSIEYQKPDTAAVITVTGAPAEDGMVKIEVNDNGIGIKPEYRQTIFNMFKRLHSRSEHGGTGIGLSICKKIVEQYSGDIGVESEYGKGSTFWFTLPAAKVSAEAVLQS